jgi:hypothetical protein
VTGPADTATDGGSNPTKSGETAPLQGSPSDSSKGADATAPASSTPSAESTQPVSLAMVTDPDESPASSARPPRAGRAKSSNQTTKVTEDLS